MSAAGMQTTAQSGGTDVIQYAFGANANLYSDVLSVPPDALQPQIQSAFFDRRYELYEVLSKDENALTPTERHFAERRMDAIVAAYRILSNPSTRAEYDEALLAAGDGTNTPAASPRKQANGRSSSIARSLGRTLSTPSPTKRGRSRSLLQKAFNASPLSRNKSMTDLTKDSRGERRRASSSLDVGELRLQQQLLQQSRGQVPTQQLNPSSRLSAHLDAHIPPPPSSPGRYDDNQTISTIGMRGATTPQRPIRPVGILKNQGSDETDRTRPVESDNDDPEEYDFFKAYATTTNQDQDDDGGDADGSPIQQHRRRHRNSRRSSRSGSHHRRSTSRRRKYESEEEETTVVDDDETSATRSKSSSSKKYDDITSLGCSALAPMDFLLRPGRVFRAVREEVTGAAADTTSAFDQVCHVFTLRSSEISAVVGEIDGAKRELSPEQNQKAKTKTKKKTTAAALAKSRSSSAKAGGASSKSKSRERSRSSSRR